MSGFSPLIIVALLLFQIRSVAVVESHQHLIDIQGDGQLTRLPTWRNI